MLLQEVLERIPGVRWNGRGDILIGGIAYDSRLVRAGDLFVAIRGEKEDGARFIGEALSRGAAAVASEAPSAPLPGEARIVVEDAPAGLNGARAAGMKTIGVLTTHAALAANEVVKSLADLAEDAFDKVMSNK